ncbi:Serine/threonine-protein kinase pkn1 [Diplonema papillatum]|nr:Serine/threonine-protein kinase pkn1 [Diplonema papillatum]
MHAATVVVLALAAVDDAEKRRMVHMPGGAVFAGTNDLAWNKNRDGDGPPRKVHVKPFYIDAAPVTNDEFKAFVRTTGHRTNAERFGWSFVLDSLASAAVLASDTTEKLETAPHWLAVQGAYWRMPEGKGSSIVDRGDHPVVHVDYYDADAYCKSQGKRLPYESEWEYACRGDASSHDDYPWGTEPLFDGELHMMNIWQGDFPKRNTEADGFHGTCPVRQFDSNPPGTYGMLGNVWEWTATLFSKAKPEEQKDAHLVLKGGSFVDSVDGFFNHKVRCATRMGNTPDSGSQTTGFRCAASGDEGEPTPDPPRGQGGQKGIDQERLGDILERDGASGVQEYLESLGVSGSVMTGAQLRDRAAKKKDEL